MTLCRSLFVSMALLVFLWPSAASSEVQTLVFGVMEGESEDWQVFSNYLQKSVSNTVGEEIQVEVRADMSFAQIRTGLGNNTLSGAIISPYRYVLLTSDGPDTNLVARVRRGGSTLIPHGEQCTGKELRPDTHYQGVLITKVNEDAWPLGDKNVGDIVLGVRGPQSTSSFLFPAEFLHKAVNQFDSSKSIIIKEVYSWQDLKSEDALNIAAALAENGLPEVASVDGGDADEGEGEGEERAPGVTLTKDEREALSLPIKDYYLLMELGKEDGEINFAGISNKWLQGYKGATSFFRVIWRSPRIPYDPFILSAGVDPKVAAEIKRVLLSTQTIETDTRDKLFQVKSITVPKLRAESEPLPLDEIAGTQKFCRRFPDIYSFVAAEDSDYDIVRRTAVSLSGGEEIRMALSEKAHWNWAADEAYFQELKSSLIKPRMVDIGPDGHKRPLSVYLNYTLMGESFPDLADILERGDYDIVELNAREAGRLAYNKSASLLSHAIYRDKRIQDGTDELSVEEDREYRMVLVSSEEDVGLPKLMELIESACIAVANEDTSSVSRYGLYYFNRRRDSPLPASRLKNVDGRRGVVRALLDFQKNTEEPTVNDDCKQVGGGARYGLLSEFDYIRMQGELHGLHATPIEDFRIPNAMLLVSRKYAPYDEDLHEDKSFSQTRLRSLIEPDPVKIPEAELMLRRAALRELKNTIKESRSAYIEIPDGKTGFRGLATGDRSGALKIARVHGEFAKNYMGLIFGAIGLLVIGTAFIVWRAYWESDDDQFLIDKLQLGGDERIQQFIHHAIAVRIWLNEHEREATLKRIFSGEGELMQRTAELDSRIVTLIGFYKSEAHIADYTGFLRALTSLAEYVEETMETVNKYESEHETGAPGEETLSSDYSPVAEQTFKVALDMARALMGKG